MAQSQINVRVDEQTKKDAERVCQDIGLSLSAAINVYLKRIVRDNKIPFELEADPFYDPRNIGYLNDIIDEYENGKLETSKHDLIED